MKIKNKKLYTDRRGYFCFIDEIKYRVDYSGSERRWITYED